MSRHEKAFWTGPIISSTPLQDPYMEKQKQDRSSSDERQTTGSTKQKNRKKEKKKEPLPPLLYNAIESSKSNRWTAAQLIFILAIVFLAYFTGIFDIGRMAQLLGLLSTPSGAQKILAENPLIDGHNDFLMLVRSIYGNRIYSENFTKPFQEGGLTGHFDIPRAKAGQMGGTFWSAWVRCPADGLDFSDENYAPFVKATLEQIDLFNRIAENFPKYFTLPRDAKEAENDFLRHGKLISPLAIEGLHQIGNSISTLRLYHELGVRYATLNWNCHNRYSDAAVINIDGVPQRSNPYHGGVSKAGHALIREMNRLGMLVDLSHVSPDTMRDVLGGTAKEKGWKGSEAPPIFSHSSVYEICPHPRNVPDDVLHLVKKANSVVMINFDPEFISCKDVGAETGLPEFVNSTNTIEQVVRHITYVGDLIGYDHVGLGSDFNGISTTPRGLEGVDKYPDLINLLLEHGVSEKDVAKVAGRNVLRVWNVADRVAQRLQKSIDPVEDELSERMGSTSVAWDEVEGVDVRYEL